MGAAACAEVCHGQRIVAPPTGSFPRKREPLLAELPATPRTGLRQGGAQGVDAKARHLETVVLVPGVAATAIQLEGNIASDLAVLVLEREPRQLVVDQRESNV